MANNKQQTYWPHMIVGFFFIGISLGYWTVKSASSMPVQKSNNYMEEKDYVDGNINEILKKKIAFDKAYTIILHGKELKVIEDNVHSKVKQPQQVVLSKGLNSFVYTVEKHNGSVVLDADVSFQLTRPHSTKDDLLIENIAYESGEYRVKDIEITHPGRYTLQLRATVGDKVGYLELPAYLKP